MRNVLEYLQNWIEAHPNKIAAAMREKTYTFQQLGDLAAKLAAAFPNGIKNRPVGVLANRDVDVIALILAVIYSGNFYIPIDPDMPHEKIQAILDDAQPEIILGCEETKKVLENVKFDGSFLTINDAAVSACDFPNNGADDPLYMVYTSGSTGKPKGVLKSHSAVISYIEAYCDTFSFSGQEVIGNQTPLFFDAAAKDLYLMLKTGATLEMIPTELFAMPTMLIEYLDEREITFVSWVPTALSIVAQLNTFSYIIPKKLKRVFFVGEVMPMKHLNKWRNALPDVEFVNLYGQSEIAGICCYYKVTDTFENDQTLPMGKPLSNCKVYLMDGDSIVNEPEHIGELYIVSSALATCYYHDEQKTEASFLLRDFGNGLERCFKTGDLAKYDDNGNLIFASRADYQIKHMGHRIELGEIEAVANALPEIQRCCCLYDKKRSRIILFCQLASELPPKTPTELQSLLRPRLSSYMLPSRIVLMDQLPINANGKIDRQSLTQTL